MADMIEMVMSHEHSRERIEGQIVFLKHLLQSSKAYSGINDDSALIRPQIIAVAATSA
jgi:hypothetical protein